MAMNPFPKFQAKLDAWVKTQPLVAGQQVQLTVFHSKRCLFLKKKGDCSCNPRFSYKPVPVNPGDIISLHGFNAPPRTNN